MHAIGAFAFSFWFILAVTVTCIRNSYDADILLTGLRHYAACPSQQVTGELLVFD